MSDLLDVINDGINPDWDGGWNFMPKESKIEIDAALPQDMVFLINTKLSSEEREAVRGMSVEELARWLVENRKLSVITNVGPPEK